jgi:mono/diheme cytochrome c family protein
VERHVKRALVLLSLAACFEERPAARDAGARPAPAAPRIASPESTEGTVKTHCQSCHSLRLIDQQRLTAAQWAKVLEKMKGWGSAIEAADIPPLAERLALQHGPDSKLPAPQRIDAAAAAREFAVLDDGPLAGGDPRHGAELFGMRCAVCHAADAHGRLGVNLTDRLILQRAPEFAVRVREGRGQMLPNPDLTDAQVGQLLAYLRSL